MWKLISKFTHLQLNYFCLQDSFYFLHSSLASAFCLLHGSRHLSLLFAVSPLFKGRKLVSSVSLASFHQLLKAAYFLLQAMLSFFRCNYLLLRLLEPGVT